MECFDGHGRAASLCFMGKIEEAALLMLEIGLVAVEMEGTVAKEV